MHIDSDKARNILFSAFKTASEDGYQLQSEYREQIRAVVQGTHKTFRYILVTALLGASLPSLGDCTVAQGRKKVCSERVLPVPRFQ